jgi:hypothetical protein
MFMRESERRLDEDKPWDTIRSAVTAREQLGHLCLLRAGLGHLPRPILVVRLERASYGRAARLS